MATTAAAAEIGTGGAIYVMAGALVIEEGASRGRLGVWRNRRRRQRRRRRWDWWERRPLYRSWRRRRRRRPRQRRRVLWPHGYRWRRGWDAIECRAARAPASIVAEEEVSGNSSGQNARCFGGGGGGAGVSIFRLPGEDGADGGRGEYGGGGGGWRPAGGVGGRARLWWGWGHLWLGGDVWRRWRQQQVWRRRRRRRRRLCHQWQCRETVASSPATVGRALAEGEPAWGGAIFKRPGRGGQSETVTFTGNVVLRQLLGARAGRRQRRRGNPVAAWQTHHPQFNDQRERSPNRRRHSRRPGVPESVPTTIVLENTIVANNGQNGARLPLRVQIAAAFVGNLITSNTPDAFKYTSITYFG